MRRQFTPFILVFLIGFSLPIFSQVPKTLSYQAVLANADGTPVANGNYDLTFRLYTSASGGSALWEENHNSVSITDGIVNATLGSSTVLDLAFDEAYWLGITVGSEAEMAPRIALTSSAYSLVAQRVSVPLEVDYDGEDDVITITTTGQTSAGLKSNINNINSTNSAVVATTNGIGAAVFAQTFSFASAGLFQSLGPNITNPALKAETFSNSGGAAFVANQLGSSNDVAIFQNSGVNVARIEKNGVGYFNGGTQTGGADIAEAFEVEGATDAYEPGDVMVISTNTDRTLEKSQEAYSTKVVGVFATKPGVLLSERHIDDSHEDMIPLGVVGVIPTKVSSENGPILRGDLLVTATETGYAMKGTDKNKMLGAVIGKALENFSEDGTGVIKVLVNVK